MINFEALKNAPAVKVWYPDIEISAKDIVKFREAEGLSQAALANILRVPTKDIVRWEQNKRKVPEATAVLLYLLFQHPQLKHELRKPVIVTTEKDAQVVNIERIFVSADGTFESSSEKETLRYEENLILGIQLEQFTVCNVGEISLNFPSLANGVVTGQIIPAVYYAKTYDELKFIVGALARKYDARPSRIRLERAAASFEPQHIVAAIETTQDSNKLLSFYSLANLKALSEYCVQQSNQVLAELTALIEKLTKKPVKAAKKEVKEPTE